MNRAGPIHCRLCGKPIEPDKPRVNVSLAADTYDGPGKRLAHYHEDCWEKVHDAGWAMRP